ncbi:MAG: hypothetical protein M3P93_00390 [Actinomycetota bacterium]|nr:hypothetical protein [Actinomycetota bacterium]
MSAATWAARPLEPTPPPIDPSAPVPDDPGELEEPGLLPPAPVESAVPAPSRPAPTEPEPA